MNPLCQLIGCTCANRRRNFSYAKTLRNSIPGCLLRLICVRLYRCLPFACRYQAYHQPRYDSRYCDKKDRVIYLSHPPISFLGVEIPSLRPIRPEHVFFYVLFFLRNYCCELRFRYFRRCFLKCLKSLTIWSSSP